MSESNVEVARRGFDAMLRGDVDVIGEMLDPNVKWYGGDPSSGCQNRTETLEFMRNAVARRGPFAEFAELVDIVDAGDRVVVIMRPRSRGDQGDEPAPQWANVTTFRDGKVVEMVHYPDATEGLAAARG